MENGEDLVLPPEAQKVMVESMAEALHTYLDEFTKQLFPDYTTPHAQDMVSRALAETVRRYQERTGTPIAAALAHELLD